MSKWGYSDVFGTAVGLVLAVVWFSITPVLFRHAYADLAHAVMPLIEAAAIFGLNYFWLIERLLYKKRSPMWFVVANLLVILLFRFDMQLLQLFMDLGPKRPEDHAGVGHSGRDGRYPTMPFSLVKSLFTLALPTLFALAIKGVERWRKLEIDLREADNRRLQAELTNLKEQVQPHFLFNSLNSIYALIAVAPDKARHVTHALGKLLRYTLEGTAKEHVDLHAEIEFIARYIDLMGIRQPPNLTLHTDLPTIQPGSYRIAPLVLIPAVENAFKHGISPTLPSRIDIRVSINDEQLEMEVSNTRHPRTDEPPEGMGLGLDNLRSRLQLLYPGRSNLSVDTTGDVYSVRLNLQLDKASA